ncbi:hypothetical protein Pan97_03320 [Bremerella volcania]|uniref:PsbP C-terminal domain-containing protein n=1 Tax=Bremerella volcania TaxID=2527984 RepID=A0A518C2C4_9BACT|nr:hypothetical protein [Bremerella volcania]QDU73362.1 hypothetical protein Pan97_03320 [Bremerella volcania]
MMLRMSLVTCAVLLLAALGCTSEPTPPAPAGGGSAASPKPTGGAAAPKVSLAPAGEATPPLDGGRVQSNMPQGWKFLPRSNDYLFAAYYEDKGGIPRLVLRESDAGGLPETTSADSAKQLVAKITEEVGADKDAAMTVVNIGNNWFVRYEKAMKFRSLAASGVFLETVRSGKRFSIELLTYSVDKEKFLPGLYRFAADLKVEATEEPEAPKEEVEAPSESTEPTEEKPSEASPEDVPAPEAGSSEE